MAETRRLGDYRPWAFALTATRLAFRLDPDATLRVPEAG